jgi:hypothetical protein
MFPHPSSRKIFDYGMQLQAFLAGAPPVATLRYGFFELNPLIINQLWPIVFVLSILASILAYNYNIPQQHRGRKPPASVLGLYGLMVALFSTAGLMLITGEYILREYPSVQDLGARLFFVLIFVGLGLFMGWLVSRTSQLFARNKPNAD